MVALLSVLLKLLHVLEAGVCAHHFEADIHVEQGTTFFHDEARVETRPHLDIVCVKRVSVCLVEALLADGLELERPHHAVEEDLEEAHVVLVVFLHDLDPLDGDLVGDTIVLG